MLVIEKSRRMQDYKRARCETDTQQGPVLYHLKPLYSGHVLLINLNLRWRSLVLVVKKKHSCPFAEKCLNSSKSTHASSISLQKYQICF